VVRGERGQIAVENRSAFCRVAQLIAEKREPRGRGKEGTTAKSRKNRQSKSVDNDLGGGEARTCVSGVFQYESSAPGIENQERAMKNMTDKELGKGEHNKGVSFSMWAATVGVKRMVWDRERLGMLGGVGRGEEGGVRDELYIFSYIAQRLVIPGRKGTCWRKGV